MNPTTVSQLHVLIAAGGREQGSAYACSAIKQGDLLCDQLRNVNKCRVEVQCVGCSMHPEVQELAIHPNLNITHEGDARSEL